MSCTALLGLWYDELTKKQRGCCKMIKNVRALFFAVLGGVFSGICIVPYDRTAFEDEDLDSKD